MEEEGPGSLRGKLRVQWRMPQQDDGRWRDYDHPGTLFDKYIGFGAAAVAADGEEEIRSEPEAFRQDEIDTARQEYMDYEREWVPPRLFWGRPSSANVHPGELNRKGDYGVYIASPVLLQRLEALRAVLSEQRGVETALYVTNAFRNPVHQTEHIGSEDSESWHQYGFAADIRIWDHAETREEFWNRLRRAAKQLPDPGCVEPRGDLWVELEDGRVVLSHFHVDWRAESCKPGW